MKRSILTLLLVLAGVRSEAAFLTVLSYDMPNGYGQAHGGTFNYWDANYTGSGNKTTDGAPLSGGLGALTDGVITNQPWFNVENTSGTGPYVGWTTIDPTIAFHFANGLTYQQIDVFVDNSGVGGVSAPSSIVVSDGVHSQTFPVTIPAFGNPINIPLNVVGLGLTGNTVQVTLDRNLSGNFVWVFAQEVTFQGTTGIAVPEPASLVLLGLGCGGILLVARRARKKPPE
jgi:hypothetical protein